MSGQHNDRFVRSNKTEGDDDGDTILSSPIVTDEPTTFNTSSTISTASTMAPFTVPVTKNLVFHHPHPSHRYQRQGRMYDQSKDLMDALPPEILDQLLLSFDKSTLLQCSVLSRRWSRRVMPHLWYRPWMKYYISWMLLLQTVSGGRGADGRGAGGRGGQQQQQQHGGLIRIVGSNSQPVGLGLTQQQQQHQQEEQQHQQEKQQQQDDNKEWEDHAGGDERGRGVMVTTTFNNPCSQEQGASTTPSPSSSAFPLTYPIYGTLIKILDFSHLHYILSDTFLSHLFPHTPFLQQLIIDSPKQFSDDSLFSVAKYCSNLVKLELSGCVKVSDTGMEAVFEKCWKLKTVVLSNVVGGGEDGDDGGGRVGNSSKASSSNHSLTLTHKTLDHLVITTPPSNSKQDLDITTTTAGPMVRKLHTLNLANGLRFPTSSEIDPSSSLSLTQLLRTYSFTLVSLNLSFCGPAVTDTLLSQYSSSSLSLPLQHLNIAFCFEVTDIGLVALSEKCPDLQQLDITGLTQVSDKAILAIGQRCKKFRQLVMVDERHRSNAGGSVGSGAGQWCSQNPLITDEVLNRFSWGARVVQRRDELLGQKKSPRIF
ncbi:hypothetical protein BG015_005853 [Linnemannia schmuckeri]|uniref:F-box domain-containing protein n=1 Tax=Linnemannia schmuckeri TaxID=64567 RepID=A0A9P5R5V8_9FUNG|nr:hypothetical protein BG015_005853 [Linnemannia schmuckeri]